MFMMLQYVRFMSCCLKTLMIGLQVRLRGVGVFIVIILLEAAVRASMEKMGQQVRLHNRNKVDF